MKLIKNLPLAYWPTVCTGLLLITIIASCQKELNFDKVPAKEHNLVLKFRPVVQFDSIPLEWGTTYTNAFKEKFTPTAFKFYIHGIALMNSDSPKTFRPADKYYLIDFADSASTEIKIAVLPYVYNQISFIIGVDSAHNVSGAQTGALDPANGMFWSRTTGYIMAKLEGTSPQSDQGGRFEFHIGGFSGTNNVIKKLPPLFFPFNQNIDLKPGKTTEMFITADAYDWFNNPHDIRISQNPVISTTGDLARQVAENYSDMFTVDSIANNAP
jgi:hypothetical protein